MKFALIKTTYPELNQAKKLAEILLDKKLSACVQFCAIESCYIWDEKINHAQEILVEIKAKATFYDKIEQEILQNHPYKNPEIIMVNIEKGSRSYLDWIEKN